MSPNPPVEPQLLLDVYQAARLLSVHSVTVRRLINAGELPHRRIGTRILIPRTALEAFVRKSHPLPKPKVRP